MAVASFAWVTPTDLQAQQTERKKKTAVAEKKQRRVPPRQTQSPSGYASCESGVLWVGSKCQLRDGRTCNVDEYDLINCH
jgi:hypothetical protein